jgi:hypothetical protein
MLALRVTRQCVQASRLPIVACQRSFSVRPQNTGGREFDNAEQAREKAVRHSMSFCIIFTLTFIFLRVDQISIHVFDYFTS